MKWGTASSQRTLNLSSDPGSKAFAPPSRLRNLHGLARNQLVDERAFPGRGPEQAADALEVFALAERTPHDDRHLRVGNVEPLVEHSSGHQRPELPVAESGEDFFALLAADIASERHDEVLAGNRVRGLVVGRKHERARLPVAIEQ